MTQEEKLLKIAQSLYKGFFYKRHRIQRVYVNRWARQPNIRIECYIEAVNDSLRVIVNITNSEQPRAWSEIREKLIKQELEIEIKNLEL